MCFSPLPLTVVVCAVVTVASGSRPAATVRGSQRGVSHRMVTRNHACSTCDIRCLQPRTQLRSCLCHHYASKVEFSMYFAAVERRQVRDPDRVVRGHTCHEEHPDSDDHIWLLGIGPRSGHDLPGRIAKRQAHSLWVLQRHQLKETTLSADTHAQPIGLTRSQILLFRSNINFSIP